MSKNELRRQIIRAIESVLNAEIPGTPRLTGRQAGGRVMYVALPGTGKRAAQLSTRAAQFYTFLKRNRKASAAALQVALKVNRNVVAGAVHELKKSRLVKSEPA